MSEYSDDEYARAAEAGYEAYCAFRRAKGIMGDTAWMHLHAVDKNAWTHKLQVDMEGPGEDAGDTAKGCFLFTGAAVLRG